MNKGLIVDKEEEEVLLSARESRDSMGNDDFDYHGLVLLSSQQQPRYNNRDEYRVSSVGGVALIVGMQIGSGIFSSPGVVARNTGSILSGLVVWSVAALLSWAGASSFAELGSAIPVNGGPQAYLSAAFGSFPAYCFSFTSLTVLKPGSQAIILIILGEYLTRVFYHTAFATHPEEAAEQVPQFAIKITALIALFLLAGLHVYSSKAGPHAQLVLTSFKVFALFMVFVGGLVYWGLGRTASEFSFDGSTNAPAGYALALFSALWTFDGWDQANYVAKDCKSGELPKIIHSSMGLVTLLFLAANVSYFIVLPFDVATATATIGLDFGRAITGPVGGVVFAFVISISCLGAINGSLYTAVRLVIAATEQNYLPELFSRLHETRQTPIYAILLSTGLSTVFILFGDFTQLTLFYGVSAWTWNFLVVVGLLTLRVKEPALKRPYRTWLITPILFCSTALSVIILSLFTKPWQSLGAFGFCLVGSIPWYLHTKQRETRSVLRSEEGYAL